MLRLSTGIVAWGGCLLASLSIAGWSIDLGHAICGPWGCGPPLQALIACHLGWIVVLAPPTGWVAMTGSVSNRLRRKIGLTLIAIGSIALLIVLIRQRIVWFPRVAPWQREYLWQRYGFSIATAVDFPMVQALLAGALLSVASFYPFHRRGSRPHQSTSFSEEALPVEKSPWQTLASPRRGPSRNVE